MKACKKIISTILATILFGSAIAFNLSQDKDVTAETPIKTEQTNAAEGAKMVTLTQDSIEVTGSTATVSTNGYNGNNSICLTAGSPKMYLYIDGLDQYKTNTRVHVSLRFYLEYAIDTANITTWYSPLQLSKEGGLYVDSDMPREKWNFINYDTVVMERHGRKCVQLNVSGNAGEVMYISTPTVSADQTEEKYTLGGCQIYHLPAKHPNPGLALTENYIIISPTGKVVVIDGGDEHNASDLYDFIIQFTNKVDHWFISHYHSDHVKALITMLQNPLYDIQIENLHYNFPTKEKCQAGFAYIASLIPNFTGDETAIMEEYKAALNAGTPKVLNRVTSTMGQVYDLGGDCRIKVISDPDFEPNTNYGNNTSLMYKLETAGENVLFLNDIGDTGNEYITANPTINYTNGTRATFREEIADCAYVQLGHHGQRGPLLDFYNYCTDMRICLYAAMGWLMNNDGGSGLNSTTNVETLATRDFMREKGVYKFYSQEMGVVKLV